MITLDWREGSIEEVVALSRQVPEFNNSYGEDEYRQRLAKVEHLIQIGTVQGEPAAFKVGYALDDTTFYSWMGAALPDFRGLGVAQSLLEAQEAWAIERGYRILKVKSRNRYAGMLCLLLRNRYQIVDFEAKGETALDHRIHFAKELRAAS